MLQFVGSPWTGALVAVAAVAVVVALVLRYRSLQRSGSPLPPGAGGARMVGTTGTVVGEHVPGGQRGRVRVLGEEWTIADAVTAHLRAGETVRVEEVTGTRLVVCRTDGAPDPGTTAAADDIRR